MPIESDRALRTIMDFKKRYLKAIIFDMDGLLVDSEPLQWVAMNEALKPFEIAIHEKEWGKMVGKKTIENLDGLNSKYKLGADVVAIEKKKNQVYSQLLEKHLVLMPGVMTAIKNCMDLKLRLAVASSSIYDDVIKILSRFNLVNYFEVIISGDQVSSGKPEPDIFLKTAEDLCESPSSCVVLEDTENGVKAAKAAGMYCIAIPNRFTAGQNLHLADKIVKSLEQINGDTLISLTQR